MCECSTFSRAASYSTSHQPQCVRVLFMPSVTHSAYIKSLPTLFNGLNCTSPCREETYFSIKLQHRMKRHLICLPFYRFNYRTVYYTLSLKLMRSFNNWNHFVYVIVLLCRLHSRGETESATIKELAEKGPH